MKFEIESAANFLSNMLKMHSSILSPEQLERFKEAIESHLEDHYQHHWFPDRPTKGSGYRCIRINHKMDPILSRAGQSCGIDSKDLRTIFPNELTLWVDPSEVAYRIGENGSICVLFDGQPNDNDSCLKMKGSKSPNSLNNSDTHKKMNNKTRTTSGGRSSPTDSTLSSSTSTMSSPSPSSSPDWIRYERHNSPDNWKSQVSRSSPVSVMNPMNGGHNSTSSSFGINSMEGVGLFGFPSHHSLGQSAYSFNSGVVNSSGSLHHQHHHHHHRQQHHPQNGPQQSHFSSHFNGWGSPFRGWWWG